MSNPYKDLRRQASNVQAALVQLGGGLVRRTRAVGLIRIAADVADAETVTIGANVYEFDRAENGVVAGRIAVTGHADDTPAEASDALIAAINASGTEPVTAYDISANEILLVLTGPKSPAPALAETMGGANNLVEAFHGGKDHNVPRFTFVQRVPTAQEVALGNLHIPVDFRPDYVLVEVRTTADWGTIVAWGGTITLDRTNNIVRLVNGTDPDWAATHTVQVWIWGSTVEADAAAIAD